MGCHRIAWGGAGIFIEKKKCELRKHGKEERCQVYGVIKAVQVKKGWCDFYLQYRSCLLVWMQLVLIFPPKERSFKTTNAQVPFQINNIGISIGSTRTLLLFCFHSLDDSLGWNISPVLEELSNGYLLWSTSLFYWRHPNPLDIWVQGWLWALVGEWLLLPSVCTQILPFLHISRHPTSPLQPQSSWQHIRLSVLQVTKQNSQEVIVKPGCAQRAQTWASSRKCRGDTLQHFTIALFYFWTIICLLFAWPISPTELSI